MYEQLQIQTSYFVMFIHCNWCFRIISNENWYTITLSLIKFVLIRKLHNFCLQFIKTKTVVIQERCRNYMFEWLSCITLYNLKLKFSRVEQYKYEIDLNIIATLSVLIRYIISDIINTESLYHMRFVYFFNYVFIIYNQILNSII